MPRAIRVPPVAEPPGPSTTHLSAVCITWLIKDGVVVAVRLMCLVIIITTSIDVVIAITVEARATTKSSQARAYEVRRENLLVHGIPRTPLTCCPLGILRFAHIIAVIMSTHRVVTRMLAAITQCVESRP